jgi:prepilin-type N-terminal cleavage/methylation domain-containing protein
MDRACVLWGAAKNKKIFQTMKKSVRKKSSRNAFTLIEVMIAVTIAGVILNIAAPNVVRARERARATACIKNLRTIDGAKEQWALTTNAAPNATVTGGMPTLAPYLKSTPVCPSGGAYSINAVGTPPACGTSGGPFAHALP